MVPPSTDAAPSGRVLIWHYPHWGNQGGSPGTAIRSGKWKLIRWQWPERVELFDLEADPGETKNLAAEQPEIVGDLSRRIMDFLGATKALQPHKNPDLKGDFKKW
jgi:arylsulfatase A-like enzyme